MLQKDHINFYYGKLHNFLKRQKHYLGCDGTGGSVVLSPALINYEIEL